MTASIRSAISILLFYGMYAGIVVAQPIALPEGSGYLEINQADFAVDSLNEYTGPDDITAAGSDIFQKQEEAGNGFDMSVSTYWLKFSLQNQNNRDKEWVLNFGGWSFVDLYISNNDGGWDAYKTGHLVPFYERHYPVGNNCHILLDVEAGDTLQCLARLQFSPDNFIMPADLSFTVGTRAFFDLKNQEIKRYTFIFLGIFLVMFFYHLFIYVSTRNISYLYYIGIVALMLVMITSNSGYLIEFLRSFTDFPLWRGRFESTVSSGIPILMIFFTMSILNTKETMPRLHKFMRILFWLIVALTILVGISFQTFGFLVMLLTVVTVVTFITAGITAVIRKLPSGSYYLLAYTFSLAGVMTMFMGLSGVIPKTDFALYYSMPLGYTLEILLYSLALANIINVLKKENANKQEKIIAQLKDNQLLQTKVTRELEEKVFERTKEIREQHEIIEKEKEKSDALLLNILPESTAEELKTKGFATTKSFKNVSVMFTDFKDFTRTCEHMTADELVENLDACFKKFDDITTEFKLEKIKTIGDSYMCAEGIPDEEDSRPENIIKAAFRMLEFMEEWNITKSSKGEPIWPMRIGINSGPITAGVVGKKKFTYDIWGDAVNLASRMESSGQPGKVNVSEFTRDLVKGKFKFISRGEIPAKNYGNVEMFFVELMDNGN